MSNINEIKRHIHEELFGKEPVSPILHLKEYRKERAIFHSIMIMQNHELREREILDMLQYKFFLTENDAIKVLKKFHEQAGGK